MSIKPQQNVKKRMKNCILAKRKIDPFVKYILFNVYKTTRKCEKKYEESHIGKEKDFLKYILFNCKQCGLFNQRWCQQGTCLIRRKLDKVRGLKIEII